MSPKSTMCSEILVKHYGFDWSWIQDSVKSMKSPVCCPVFWWASCSFNHIHGTIFFPRYLSQLLNDIYISGPDKDIRFL
jgi:hypothetical protein